MTMTSGPTLEPLHRLVGTWTTASTHPALPGVVMRGTVTVEWLEGQRFLIHHARTDHPDVPDATSITGWMGHDRVEDATGTAPTAADQAGLRMHYFDSRGVFRVFEVAIDETAWRWWRDAPGFSQQFTGTFEAGGDVIVGRSQLRQDDLIWKDDLETTYRRQE